MSDEVEDLVEAGLVLLRSGDLEGSQQLTQEAQRLAPEDPRVIELAEELRRAGGTATPFEAPPVDLFADLPVRPAANPFAAPMASMAPLSPSLPAPRPPADPFSTPPSFLVPPSDTPTDKFGGPLPAPAPAAAAADPLGALPWEVSGPRGPGVASSPPSDPFLLFKSDGRTPQPAPKPPTMPPRLSIPSGSQTMPAGVGRMPETGEMAHVVRARAAPPPAPPQESEEGLLAEARDRLAFDDYSGAMGVLDRLLADQPKHPEALKLKGLCEQQLLSMLESKLGDTARKPKLRLRLDEVIWLNLDHRAGFILSQVDGDMSIEDLYSLSGMSRLDTARILVQLVEERVISL
jgi:hypothetical protein